MTRLHLLIYHVVCSARCYKEATGVISTSATALAMHINHAWYHSKSTCDYLPTLAWRGTKKSACPPTKGVILGTTSFLMILGIFIAEDTGRADFHRRGGQDIFWTSVLFGLEEEDIKLLIWTPFDSQSYSEAKSAWEKMASRKMKSFHVEITINSRFYNMCRLLSLADWVVEGQSLYSEIIAHLRGRQDDYQCSRYCRLILEAMDAFTSFFVQTLCPSISSFNLTCCVFSMLLLWSIHS